ncbi:MAG: WYL domain-containing protein, partial [Chloroflexota bacterium]
VRALFMLSIPAPLNQLGVGDELRMALLKLSAALPDSRRVEEAAARQKIHLDASWWFQPEEPLPHLKTIKSALWRDLQLDIIYRSDFGAEIPIHLAPYGLVAKANIWYLVGASEGIIRVLRVSQLRQASISDDTFMRPLDFDLPVYWKAWCDEYENSRPQYMVTARVSPQLAELLSGNISSVQMQTTSFQPDDWQIMQLGFESLETARAQILGYGGAIEVLSPLALRRSVMDFALQTAVRYASRK